jgi:hypothetical protein
MISQINKKSIIMNSRIKYKLVKVKNKIYYPKLIIGILYLMISLFSISVFVTAFIINDSHVILGAFLYSLIALVTIAIIFITHYGILWIVQGLKGKK